MYLYNSATRKKELFVPNHPDIVKMYTATCARTSWRIYSTAICATQATTSSA